MSRTHRLRKTVPMRRCLVLVLSLAPFPGSSLGAVWMASPTLGPTSRARSFSVPFIFVWVLCGAKGAEGRGRCCCGEWGEPDHRAEGMTDHRCGALLNGTGNHGQSCGSTVYLALAVHYLGSQVSHLQNGIKSSSCSQDRKRIKE